MEVTERLVKIAFRHKRVAVVHQSARVARTFNRHVPPERLFCVPNFVALKRGVAVSAQKESDRDSCSGFCPQAVSNVAIDQQLAGTSHCDYEPDIREERAVIVHDFGQRQCRRRQERDQKPEQTETDNSRFLEHDSRDRGHSKKSYESETRPETRIVCCCKRIEVVVSGETAGPEERLKVEQRHVGLRDQVIVRVRCACDPTAWRHALNQQQHCAANYKGHPYLRGTL